MTVPRSEEDTMSVPPRPTEEPTSGWDVPGERPPVRGREEHPDRGGLLLVVGVVLALAVALALLFIL
jgi:hypothetical protein